MADTPDYGHGAQGGAKGHWNPDGSWTWDTGNFAGTTIAANQAQANKDLYDQSVADPAAAAAAQDSFSKNNGQGKYEGNGRASIQGVTDLQNTLAGLLHGGEPGAQLDTSLADESRGRLGGLLEQLQQQAATGNGSWENTLKTATEKSQADASALGQSNPSLGYQSALRGIGNAQSGAAQRAVGQGNILREQSKLDANNQLGDLLAGQNSQDVTQAINQAGARQGARQVNNTLEEQTAKNTQAFASGAAQAIPVVGSAVGSTIKTMSDGGRVPGKPKVFGDDEKNDTVPAILSPGEVVLPRSISHDPQAAAAFVMSLNARGRVPHMAAGGPAPWKVGDNDTTAEGGFNFLGGSRQAPSIENGALLDTTAFTQGRNANLANDEMFAARGAGTGPSVAPQMLQNASDDNLNSALQGMQGRGQGASAAGVNAISAGTNAQQGAAGDAAAQSAKEASQGRAALGHSILSQRERDAQLAAAQQRALFANTQMNVGVSLAQQAALRNILSGAGQALSGIAASGVRGDGFQYSDSGIAADAAGDRGGPSDISGSDGGKGLDEPVQSDPSEWETPNFALGGLIPSYAGGGEVDELETQGLSGRKVPLPAESPRKPLTDAMLASPKMRKVYDRAEDEAAADASKRAEYDEETGDTVSDEKWAARKARHTKKGEPSAFHQAIARARGFVGLADGGDVMALPERRDDGPVYEPIRFGGATLPPEAVATIAAQMQSGTPGPTSKPVGPSMQAMAPGMTGGPPMDYAARSGGSLLDPAAKSVAEVEGLRLKSNAPPAAAPAPETAPPATAAKPQAELRAPGTSDRSGLLKEQEAAITTAADLEAQAARARATGLAEQQKVANEYALKEKDVQDRARQFTDDAFTRLRAAQDEMNRVDSKVDPDRFWATRSTGQKILGVIGLALGAAGTGPDGINRAAQMMNNAIDRDIEAQKAEYELRLKKGTAKLGAAQTYYGLARQAGLDEVAATHAAKAAALESAANRTEMAVATIQEPMAKNRGQQLIVAARGGAADKSDAAKQRTFENKIQLGQLDVQRELAGKKIGGGLTESERKSVGDVTAAAKDALGLIDSIEGTLVRTQSAVPGKTAFNQHVGEDAARLDTDTSQLVAKMKDINKLGQIGPADKALLEEAIGDPKAIFTLEGTKRAKLKRVKQIIIESVANERSSRGLAQ